MRTDTDAGWGRDEWADQPYGGLLDTVVAIEEAIKAGIRDAMPYVKTVDTYAGQLEEDISRLVQPFPAVFVTYGGSAFEWVDGRSFSAAPDFSVIVAARDLRGKEDLRKAEYGCYRMVADALAAIANQTFGLDILPMKPVKVALMLVSRTVAAYGIDFQTAFDTVYPPQ